MTRPTVTLVNLFDHAYDNFVATARTCYSAKGIVEPVDVAGEPHAEPGLLEQKRQRKYALAESLFKAGHHTTLQHAHAQFAISGVSRHFIWSFLHAHPFYNSEQVSQRYVTVARDNFYIPNQLTDAGRERFHQTAEQQMADYRALCKTLNPLVEEEYYGRFRGRYGSKRAVTDIKKKSQEIARYVLPIATTAYLYHTVSVITLLRYHRMSQQYDTPAEQREVVGMMIAALLEREPEFAIVMQQPLPEESHPEFQILPPQAIVDRNRAVEFNSAFDAELGRNTSVLTDYSMNGERSVADAVREVFGMPVNRLADDEAISMLLDPSKNRLLGESMNLSTLSKLSRAMFHSHYTFKKVLSHAGDSQDQRHRMTPGSRPILMAHYTGQPDFITPALFAKSDAARQSYNDSMERSWQAVESLLHAGESPESAAYLLPNAVKIRFTESGDLLNLHHKMAMRLCYNAQEEIWQASLDEALAVSKVHPRLGAWLLPPCSHRLHAGQKPPCPEGDRYCGVMVWKKSREEYERVI